MKQVLVVEDDRSIRLTLEKMLRCEGFGVTTATNGADAIEALRAGGLDLALLDLGLPQVDGLAVLAAAQDVRDRPPIVAISAREDLQSRSRAVQLGAYDYLVKPLNLDGLLLVVRRAIQYGLARKEEGDR